MTPGYRRPIDAVRGAQLLAVDFDENEHVARFHLADRVVELDGEALRLFAKAQGDRIAARYGEEVREMADRAAGAVAVMSIAKDLLDALKKKEKGGGQA